MHRWTSTRKFEARDASSTLFSLLAASPSSISSVRYVNRTYFAGMDEHHMAGTPGVYSGRSTSSSSSPGMAGSSPALLVVPQPINATKMGSIQNGGPQPRKYQCKMCPQVGRARFLFSSRLSSLVREHVAEPIVLASTVLGKVILCRKSEQVWQRTNELFNWTWNLKEFLKTLLCSTFQIGHFSEHLNSSYRR